MGIPLDIFSLYRARDEEKGCRHYLLLRVQRAAFSNADEGDYARAVDAADGRRDALIKVYEAGALADECDGLHALELSGELQARPTGDVLSGARGGFYVDLWVARTRFGHPWVVLGTAGDEGEFWREAGRDEDLSSLGPRAPAERLRAYFLAEAPNDSFDPAC